MVKFIKVVSFLVPNLLPQTQFTFFYQERGGQGKTIKYILYFLLYRNFIINWRVRISCNYVSLGGISCTGTRILFLHQVAGKIKEE